MGYNTIMEQHKESKMENDQQIWDNLLDSEEGLNAFAALMEEAKQEVADGKVEPV